MLPPTPLKCALQKGCPHGSRGVEAHSQGNPVFQSIAKHRERLESALMWLEELCWSNCNALDMSMELSFPSLPARTLNGHTTSSGGAGEGITT